MMKASQGKASGEPAFWARLLLGEDVPPKKSAGPPPPTKIIDAACGCADGPHAIHFYTPQHRGV